MTNHDPHESDSGDREDLAEIDPAAKRGNMGETAHGGRQVGPNSDQAGKPQAPQTGDPHGDDRQG